MKRLEYTLRFNTPAFLGNAEQNGQWRTPPIKAQLRQWWRVAYAAAKGYGVHVADMRREEGLLFGNAWLENEFCKSRVRLRLDRWDQGQLKKSQWPKDDTVTHPEVGKSVGSALYLGYGPLIYERASNSTTLKANAAIQANEAATLAIAVPDGHVPILERTLWLMHCFGALGGRSRNGWGSYALDPHPSANDGGEAQALPLRLWRDCLDRDWPHAIGQDEKGALIWQTAPHADWKSLMKTLAVIKIGLRTMFEFPNTKPPHAKVEPRHWLSYPVTNHSVAAWGNNARLPNQLRFKVRRAENGQLVGVIFHMPHLPPAEFHPHRPAIEDVWRKVHQFLDAPAQKLTRIPE